MPLALHFCKDVSFDEDLAALSPDFRFYYECLMAPNARSVMVAMKRMDKLDGEIKTIATGHGPLLRYNVAELTGRYREWSQQKSDAETLVAVFYVSDYGYSDRLSQSIARGITKTGVGGRNGGLRSADAQDVNEIVGRPRAGYRHAPFHWQRLKKPSAALGTILAAWTARKPSACLNPTAVTTSRLTRCTPSCKIWS